MEHNANPDITGNKLKFTYKPVCSPTKVKLNNLKKKFLLYLPRINLEINTVNIGAELFMVSVKLTAT